MAVRSTVPRTTINVAEPLELPTACPTPRFIAWTWNAGSRCQRPKSAEETTRVRAVPAWRATRPSFRIDPLAASRGEPVVDQALAPARTHLPQHVLI